MKVFKYLAIFASAALFLTGCRDDDMPDAGQGKRIEPHVQFQLTLSSGTRADDDWGGSYTGDDGEDFDKLIEDLTVVLYGVDAQGKIIKSHPVGTLDSSTITKTQSTTDKNIWTIDGVLDLTEGYTPAILESGSYRLAVFANGTISDVKNPQNDTFSIHGIPGANSFTHVPMYGVAKADFTGLSDALAGDGEDKTFTLMNGDSPLEIPMLRSLAQIKVKVLGGLYDDQKVKLTSISLNRHSESGFIVPHKWDQIDAVTELKRGESINVCTANFTTGCNPVIATDNDESDPNCSQEIRFFIPDTYNIDNDTDDHIVGNETKPHGGEELKLTVLYTVDGVERKGLILFRDYSGGTAQGPLTRVDITRNHIYEYTITGVPSNLDLECEVSIQKWGYHKITTEL